MLSAGCDFTKCEKLDREFDEQNTDCQNGMRGWGLIQNLHKNEGCLLHSLKGVSW